MQEVQPNIRWVEERPLYHEEICSHAEDSGYSNNLQSRAKACLDRALRRFIGTDGFPIMDKLPKFDPGVKIRVVFEIIPVDDPKDIAADALIKAENAMIETVTFPGIHTPVPVAAVEAHMVATVSAELTKEDALKVTAREIASANKERLQAILAALGGSFQDEDTNAMLKERIKLLQGK